MRLGNLAALAVGTAVALTTISCKSTLGPRWTGQMLEARGLPYDQPPVPITKVAPRYPEFAREARISGTVVVHSWIGADGRVKTCVVYHGVTGLDDAAVYAARQWIFRPALRKDLPVAAWYDIQFTFTL